MKIDCFPFHNETAMLKARLDWLKGHVDLHIISEMDHTHQGQPKPFYLDEVELPSNVIRLRLRDPFIDGAQAMQRERFQRNALAECIPPGEHRIYHSDVDEIPNPQIWQIPTQDTLKIRQDFYYYNLLNKVADHWALPFITSQLIHPSSMRHHQWDRGIFDGGWHLSWFGGVNQRMLKIASFAHPELDQPQARELIRLQAPRDPWGRSVKWYRLDRPDIPEGLLDCLLRYFDKKELVGY